MSLRPIVNVGASTLTSGTASGSGKPRELPPVDPNPDTNQAAAELAKGAPVGAGDRELAATGGTMALAPPPSGGKRQQPRFYLVDEDHARINSMIAEYRLQTGDNASPSRLVRAALKYLEELPPRERVDRIKDISDGRRR